MRWPTKGGGKDNKWHVLFACVARLSLLFLLQTLQLHLRLLLPSSNGERQTTAMAD